MREKSVTDRVLSALADGQWVTTRDLVRTLGITDPALRNAVHRLRTMFGARIETARVYRLKDVPKPALAPPTIGHIVRTQRHPESIRIPRHFHVELGEPAQVIVRYDTTRKLFALERAPLGRAVRQFNAHYVTIRCAGLLANLGVTTQNVSLEVECKIYNEMLLCRPQFPRQPCPQCKGEGTIPCVM